MSTAAPATGPGRGAIPADEILRIAQADAGHAYGNLLQFRVTLALADDGWHVDYELADSQLNGGGPHYVIDAVSGKIVSKRYEQ
jgi:hypothetical protein